MTSNLATKIFCVSGVATDLVNDMDADIFLTCGDGENIADIRVENDGNGVFTVVPNAGGAAGAKLHASAGGITRLREQNAGYHRWSKNQRRMPFGLANNTAVDLKVNGPSGRAHSCGRVAAEHVYVATEGGGIQQAH